jgi:glycosyltransferase involved in cell wall biosynthesis
MRVGFVIYGSLEYPSGGFLYDRMLVDSLRRAGHEVDIVSLPWESYGKCIAHALDRRIRSRILDWRGDLLLQDELAHPSLFVLNRALRRSAGVPLVSIVHHLRTSERPPGLPRVVSGAVERAYLRTVDGFVFNSGATRRAVEALGGARKPSVVVQPAGDRLGCPMTAREVRDRAASAPPLRVLFVGNVIPRKGLLTLLEALAMIPREKWRLRVVGSRAADPAHTRVVDRLLEARGLRDSVCMEDHVNDGELSGELRSCQVLAVPSSYEGFGIVYLEAMAHGVVPIGTPEGGAVEIIQDGRNGFLVPPGNPGELARVLDRLCTDRAHLSSCALAARERFAEFPGWRQQMDRIVAFLQSMVERGRD